jgi:hypothetical protein
MLIENLMEEDPNSDEEDISIFPIKLVRPFIIAHTRNK